MEHWPQFSPFCWLLGLSSVSMNMGIILLAGGAVFMQKFSVSDLAPCFWQDMINGALSGKYLCFRWVAMLSLLVRLLMGTCQKISKLKRP